MSTTGARSARWASCSGALSSPEYTLIDRINFFRGIVQSVAALYPELTRRDLFAEVPAVKVPVYFCLGRHDYEVPSVLSARYFDALEAPRKQLVWFEHSAHMPNTEEEGKFNDFMIHTVLPALPARPVSVAPAPERLRYAAAAPAGA